MNHSTLCRALLILAFIIGSIIFGYRWWRANHATHAAASNTHPALPTGTPMLFSDLSISLAPLTICEALRQSTIVFKITDDAFMPVNEAQKKFIAANYLPYMKHKMFQYFSEKELMGYASQDVEYLNKLLHDNGFSIQLEPFQDKGSVGVIAMQNVIIQWKKEGEVTKISSAGKKYDAAHLKKHVHFFTTPDDSIIVAKLQTQSNDVAYFVTKKDGELFSSNPDQATVATAIAEYQKGVHTDAYGQNNTYGDIIFPMISYTIRPNIEWLLNLEIPGYKIVQALQELIFKMNEKGAQAKAATAIEWEVTSALPEQKETLIIDKPFLIWIERPGVSMPIFADYMRKKYWKNPGSLE